MRHLTVAQGDRILRNSDLNVITGVSRTTRWRMERAGEFPARRRITNGAVGWLASEVDEWLKSRGVARDPSCAAKSNAEAGVSTPPDMS